MTDKNPEIPGLGTVKPLPPPLPQLDLSTIHPTLDPQGPVTVLSVYDPAMCCASGVCGPRVDPILAQFAGTLQSLARQGSLQVDRYNLSQQPRAFVENQKVKDLLAAGGVKLLPLIFINDELAFQARYPSKDELAHALKLKLDAGPAAPQQNSCGDHGDCCP